MGLLALCLVSGCAGRLPYFQTHAPLPRGPLCRVAVLPFANDTDFHLGGAIYHKVFQAELISRTDYVLIQEGDIRSVYRQFRLFPGHQLTTEQLALFGDRLDAQLLVTGTVSEMRENPGEHRTVNPVLAQTVRVHDARSGEVLWSTYHRREGSEYRKAMHFGKVYTVTGLAQRVAQEILQLWLEQGLTTCDVSPRY